jgi:hypothetical protein
MFMGAVLLQMYQTVLATQIFYRRQRVPSASWFLLRILFSAEELYSTEDS